MNPTPPRTNLHDPGRRFQDLPPELVLASRRAGARSETGTGDGTDLAGRNRHVDEGMHESFAGHPRPERAAFR